MATDPLDRFERLFQAAQLHPPEERAAFLDAACADDADMRRQLDELLQAHEEAEEEAFLETAPFEWPGSQLARDPAVALDEDLLGHAVGPYTVQRLIGHGGMGNVYLARRDEPFKRYVALKIIRRGMDTREVLARFSMERQILASLEHPNIARLHDGGMTGDGRPYFAMEYVEGLPITTYCDKHHLKVEERLQLFQTICHAVQHAHQNLVLHRDLKPSNILVTDKRHVKLLDFGIAKLLNPNMSPVTSPVTRTELRMMTPGYASPEQVRGHTLTTASDVYSLGVILYELLTGHRPYRLEHHSTEEILRVVCEQEPERPSTKVTQTARVTDSDGKAVEVTPETISTARTTSIEGLRRHLRGDLDNMVLMALRKEAHRRYPSAGALGEDIERYMAGLPVVARPNTLGYRGKKFVQRYRWAVATILTIVLLLVGYALTVTVQARQVRQALAQARLEATKAEQITAFMMGLFASSDPNETLGNTVTARELLARGKQRADALADQPEVQAEMLDVVGRVHQNLGDYDQAQELLENALALRRTHSGASGLNVAASLAHLGNLARLRGHYPAAESLYQQALTIQRQHLAATHPTVTETLIGLGHVLHDHGDFDRAEPMLREALATQEEALGPEHPDVIRTRSTLARVLHGKGDYDAAEEMLLRTLALRRKVYGDVHPEIADNLTQLGSLYATRDEDFERSGSYHKQALAIREQVYGENHPDVAKSLSHVATSLLFQGRPDDAEPYLRRALAINQAVQDPAHPNVGTSFNTLALLLEEKGELEEAEALFREALANYRRAFGAEHHYTAAIIGNLARITMKRGDLQTAERLARESLAIRRKALGDDHPYVIGTLSQVATVLRAQRRFEASEALFLEAVARYRQRSDTADDLRYVYGEIALLYDGWDKPEEAARYRSLQEQIGGQ